MPRLSPLFALLFGGVLTLGACSVRHGDNPQLSDNQTYECSGVNPNRNFVECNHQPHAAPAFQPTHGPRSH
jgi:hypothetical protein